MYFSGAGVRAAVLSADAHLLGCMLLPNARSVRSHALAPLRLTRRVQAARLTWDRRWTNVFCQRTRHHGLKAASCREDPAFHWAHRFEGISTYRWDRHSLVLCRVCRSAHSQVPSICAATFCWCDVCCGMLSRLQIRRRPACLVPARGPAVERFVPRITSWLRR